VKKDTTQLALKIDAIDAAKLYVENIIAEIQSELEDGSDIDYILEDVFSKLQKKK